MPYIDVYLSILRAGLMLTFHIHLCELWSGLMAIMYCFFFSCFSSRLMSILKMAIYVHVHALCHYKWVLTTYLLWTGLIPTVNVVFHVHHVL